MKQNWTAATSRSGEKHFLNGELQYELNNSKVVTFYPNPYLEFYLGDNRSVWLDAIKGHLISSEDAFKITQLPHLSQNSEASIRQFIFNYMRVANLPYAALLVDPDFLIRTAATELSYLIE